MLKKSLKFLGISENNVGFLDEEGFDESLWLDDKTFFRAKTAPARPLTEIEEFRKSKTFHIMEQAVVSSTHLVQTFNNRYVFGLIKIIVMILIQQKAKWLVKVS